MGTETWWLYVLECQGGALYTGIAKDVDARFEAHVKGTGAIFTRLNRPLRVLGKATLATKSEALRAEYAFKQLPRADKLQWCTRGLERFLATTLSKTFDRLLGGPG
ncbi:MAG: GIY-YIG nuclease family protein [Betaproteobacteria bacterium]|nr:MAG: GIY-YIG nuclease family protein [Betaproteobacteria bacterium]